MTARFLPLPAFATAAACLALAGCDAPPPPPAAPATRMEQVEPARPQAAGDLKQRQMELLNRIRAADPDAHTIDRAMLNEQNELGLILDRSVPMDKIPALMKAMLAADGQRISQPGSHRAGLHADGATAQNRYRAAGFPHARNGLATCPVNQH